MKVSLIITTYERPKNLNRLLEELNTLSETPDEIIVVFRDNDKETEKILNDFSDKKFKKIKISEPGVIKALNKGLKNATCEIVCTIDDDAIPSKDWIKKIKKHFEDPNIGAVGGIDIQPDYNGKKVDKVGRITFYGRIIGNHHLGCAEIQEVDHLKGVNMCYRKNLINEINENLLGLAPPGFELIFGFHVKNKGYKILYDPELIVFHYPGKTYDGRRGEKTKKDYFVYAHNYTYILYKYLKGLRKLLFILYTFIIGDSSSPSIVRIIFKPLLFKYFLTAIYWKYMGIKKYLKDKKFI